MQSTTSSSDVIFLFKDKSLYSKDHKIGNKKNSNEKIVQCFQFQKHFLILRTGSLKCFNQPNNAKQTVLLYQTFWLRRLGKLGARQGMSCNFQRLHSVKLKTHDSSYIKIKGIYLFEERATSVIRFPFFWNRDSS